MSATKPYPAPADALAAIVGELAARETSPGQYEARCPAHDDRRESFAASTGAEGKVVLSCHAGCTFNEIVAALSARLPLGLAPSDLFPAAPKSSAGPRGRIVETYDYFNADGVLLYQVCRLDPKDFRQRRPDGSGGWTWKTKGVEKVLYRLPAVLKAKPAVPVFVAEGEKDVHALESIGATATCNPGGAGGWLKKYADDLKGRHVVVLPDHDAPKPNGKRPGTEHALDVAGKLIGKAASVRIIDLPVAEGGDPADWVAGGGTWDELKELVAKSSPWEPGDATARPSEPPPDDAKREADADAAAKRDEELLDKLGLEVLGELADGRVVVFSRHHVKNSTMRDAARISRAELLQVAGPRVRAYLSQAKDPSDKLPGTFTLAEVRDAVALVAGRNRIADAGTYGAGVWPGLTADGEKDLSRIVVVGCRRAEIVGPTGPSESVHTPRAAGRLLDFGHPEPWYDPARLADDLAAATNPAWREAALEEASSLFGRWIWKGGGTNVPDLLAALAAATWVQTVWAWRPQVAVIGKSGSGKTELYDLLESIFGGVALKSSSSSAAGIRQSLAESACVLLCDEFDSTKARSEILELLRNAGKGGVVIRGTAHHKRVQFRLQHLAWTAGIESGLEREPDRNRWIQVETLKPEGGGGTLDGLPAAGELRTLGGRLLATAIRSAPRAVGLVDRLAGRELRPPGMDPRTAHLHAVPAAMAASAAGLSDADAAGLLAAFAEASRHADDAEHVGDDATDVLEAIFEGDVDVGPGRRYAVSEIVAGLRGEPGAPRDSLNGNFGGKEVDALGRFGLRLHTPGERGHVEPDDATHLFVAGKVVRERLLKRSEWAKSRVDQILLRLPGAERGSIRVAGKQVRGLSLPVESLDDLFGDPTGGGPSGTPP